MGHRRESVNSNDHARRLTSNSGALVASRPSLTCLTQGACNTRRRNTTLLSLGLHSTPRFPTVLVHVSDLVQSEPPVPARPASEATTQELV